MSEPAKVGEAIAFMKRASRDTFELCATSAEKFATDIQDGRLAQFDAPTALRMFAAILRSGAQRP